ncbi:nodulation protein S (NodS) [Aquimarina sp. MAR_2010_214]|uniref:class I SAM-dependent methyltransferase n=1 Tax=Aquimarina sp. MAR_2010_214 TaxID=1250026 RepID=UPI000C70707E|nr:class I SAM-dependent methyltransferase [Aquimarina sp. MAR_2010_214]PKV48269.1 nodulation protein S (NodS) [Aquimarina sp. MAR_2010_214]
MKDFDRKKHWETIYNTKELKDVSWFQKTPLTSIDLITQLELPKTSKIIDVGGGNSLLADHLLDLGYTNITVLDISETAINKAKERLGNLARNVIWIVADIANFMPTEKYDIWHDRAAFHFLNDKKEINHYMNSLEYGIQPNGFLIMGTFSENGPKKCSKIDITQYSETSMNNLVKNSFEKVKCTYIDHKTPFDTLQNFIFCIFKKGKTTLM